MSGNYFIHLPCKDHFTLLFNELQQKYEQFIFDENKGTDKIISTFKLFIGGKL